jgi:glycerol-3-phosphate O-acyltransferase
VLEDRTLLLSIDPEAKRPGRLVAAWRTLAFVLRNLRLMLRSEWHRFGYACVNFGSPVSMRAYCRSRGIDFKELSGEDRKREVAALGRHLIETVGKIVPVVPVPLIASVLLETRDKPVSELELKSEVERLIEKLEARGAHVYIPRKDLDYAITVGLRMLRLRRLVQEEDGLYTAQRAEVPLLRYYANSIAHLL